MKVIKVENQVERWKLAFEILKNWAPNIRTLRQRAAA